MRTEVPMEEKYVDVGGIRTFYLEAGTGPDLVFFHGGGIGIDAALSWSDNIGPLAERFHVIAIDEIGFGRTAMPADPSQFNKVLRADHALATLDALGIERAILIGHSEGGFMAAKIAVEHPDRVAKLVIVTSGATAPRLGGELDQPWIDAANEAYDWELESSSPDAFVENFKRSMLFHPELADEQRLRANYELARESGNMNLYLNLPPRGRRPRHVLRDGPKAHLSPAPLDVGGNPAPVGQQRPHGAGGAWATAAGDDSRRRHAHSRSGQTHGDDRPEREV